MEVYKIIIKSEPKCQTIKRACTNCLCTVEENDTQTMEVALALDPIFFSILRKFGRQPLVRIMKPNRYFQHLTRNEYQADGWSATK
jgi:hypothetical protein